MDQEALFPSDLGGRFDPPRALLFDSVREDSRCRHGGGQGPLGKDQEWTVSNSIARRGKEFTKHETI
jgi:hypothetical protein